MEIISEEEQQEIIQWANQTYHTFLRNGPGRQFQKLRSMKSTPSCVWDIKKRIIEREHIDNPITEPIFEDYIGYITHGGKIQRHTDPNRSGLLHTRFNLIVQLPEKGGMPIYADKLIKVKERTYIRCNSGTDFHECELVEGPKARIVLSFGFLFPPGK